MYLIFRKTSQNWRNTVRYTLSRSSGFTNDKTVKAVGKGSMWRLATDQEMIKAGVKLSTSSGSSFFGTLAVYFFKC